MNAALTAGSIPSDYRLRMPGPAAIPERVRAATALPILSHRGPEFRVILDEVTTLMRGVLGTTQEVFLLQNLDQAPVRMPGIVMREGERQFSAISASRDGRSVYVAQHGSENISIIDLQTRETTVLSCHCSPTVFFPLRGTSVFRLNGISNGPITVLDASTSSPRTLFIPIDPNVLVDHGER